MKKIVIIGAGPAGLTAACELLERNSEQDVIILEETSDLGGLSKTINIEGNYIDIGPHRFFSKRKRVTEWWHKLMPAQGKPSLDDIKLNKEKKLFEGGVDPETTDEVMLQRERISRIYYNNAFFDYPLTLNFDIIRSMGIINTLLIGLSYLKTLIYKLPENNLENFYINRFGRRLYSLFFEGYTEKLWGRHPKEISAQWGAQRVRGLSIKAVLKDLMFKIFRIKNQQVETSLIDQFMYPKYGSGQIWSAAAKRAESLGAKILMNKCATRFERDEKGNITKVCGDGFELSCDILISSMPIKDLVFALGEVPENIQKIALGLPYRDLQSVGVLLPREKFLIKNTTKVPTCGDIPPDSWIYVQDNSVNLGRIQIFNNWSPYMLKDFENTVWLGLEYFCTEGDESWKMSNKQYIDFAIKELVKIGMITSEKDIISTYRQRVKKAYPAYFDTYVDFDIIREYLDNIPNLYCVGRNGQHRYNNMDHSMLTAFAVADCIIDQISDKSVKSAIWDINAEQEYLENHRV